MDCFALRDHYSFSSFQCKLDNFSLSTMSLANPSAATRPPSMLPPPSATMAAAPVAEVGGLRLAPGFFFSAEISEISPKTGFIGDHRYFQIPNKISRYL
jgi:hypothetical protein